jgi:hypothetical protein
MSSSQPEPAEPNRPKRRSNRALNFRGEHVGYLVRNMATGKTSLIGPNGELISYRHDEDGSIEFCLSDGSVAPPLPSDAPWAVFLDDSGIVVSE